MVIWLKSFTLLYWVVWCILKAYLWEIVNGIESFIRTRETESTETASLESSNEACLIYYMVA